MARPTTRAGGRIVVLTTGGTIASLPGPSGGLRVALSGPELLRSATSCHDGVEVREVLRVNSFALTRADALRIAREVLSAAGDPAVAGVVVTHGTDTMEETAYLVDLLLGDAHAPVVFTGAQRHAGGSGGDGPANLADAIRVAAHPAARGLGALIVMAGRIHRARDATKAHTLALAAFESPTGGPVGAVVAGEPRIDGARPGRAPSFRLAELGDLEARVDIVPVYLDADGVQIAACRRAGARGVVLQALGAGNATPGVLEEVRACLGEGVPVLVTSRCPEGPVAPLYDGGGADLAGAGALFAGTLRAPKARILLAAALAAESGPERVAARLEPHLHPASRSG